MGARGEALLFLLEMDAAVGWTSRAGEVTFSLQCLRFNSRPAALPTAEGDARSRMRACRPAASRGCWPQCQLTLCLAFQSTSAGTETKSAGGGEAEGKKS